MIYPKGNEEEFKKKAEELGFTEIVFLYPQKNNIKTKVYNLTNKRNENPVTVGFAERKFFEKKHQYIIDSEDSPKRDNFHFKNTSLNHVHATLCKKNKISLVLGFSKLLTAPFERQKILGRMISNMRLARKYAVKTQICSLAKRPDDMRNPQTLQALERFLRTKFK
jgi:RNase P/RNase MRP subunit p30